MGRGRKGAPMSPRPAPARGAGRGQPRTGWWTVGCLKGLTLLPHTRATTGLVGHGERVHGLTNLATELSDTTLIRWLPGSETVPAVHGLIHQSGRVVQVDGLVEYSVDRDVDLCPDRGPTIESSVTPVPVKEYRADAPVDWMLWQVLL